MVGVTVGRRVDEAMVVDVTTTSERVGVGLSSVQPVIESNRISNSQNAVLDIAKTSSFWIEYCSYVVQSNKMARYLLLISLLFAI
jgi:hypothetical protein